MSVDLKIRDKSEFSRIISEEDNDIDDLLALELGDAYREYRYLWNKASRMKVVPDFPIHLGFELNHSCNLKCPMCPVSSPDWENLGKKDWFPFETFKKIIDEGISRGLKSVSLNWTNEPLLRKNVPDFAAYARDKGVIDISIHTNGIPMTEEVSERLIDSGVTRIMVSIDAITNETYEKIRIGGDLDKVKKNIFSFLSIREKKKRWLPILSVNFCRTSINEHELNDFVNYWSKHADFFAIQEYVDPFLRVSENSDEEKDNAFPLVEGFKCSKPYMRASITYDGIFMPCCSNHAPRLKIGNVFEDSASSIWHNYKMKNLRKIQKNGEYYKNNVCRSCVHGNHNNDSELTPKTVSDF